AAQESQRVSQLIKKFLYAGLDLTLAVKVLNSALAVSSENDMYTTLDICSIDLITGETEIIKNGGATVFIYDGKKVNTIRSQSLPVGVIDHWTGEKTNLQLLSDYMLIMVTDGITEALGVDYEGIYVEELIFTYGTNPEKIAQKILEGAKAKQTKENSDDMTVLTIKLYT
ncbi:MAG: SpoIIE family protein phosphatase, partial [Anaerotignaceae bacterium]